MQVDMNLTPEKRLTFSAAMSMSWFVLSSALTISAGFLGGWLSGGTIVSSTATVQKSDSGDIESVERLEVTFKNATMTWVKRHQTYRVT
jgi:uncharacterized membrane protein SpoIIM required for sporulation